MAIMSWNMEPIRTWLLSPSMLFADYVKIHNRFTSLEKGKNSLLRLC
jgi:hypothetical protein